MLRNIAMEELKASEVYRQKVEVVERKELEHPDYICDAVMEQTSVNFRNFNQVISERIL